MNLKITILQADLHWENVDKNLAAFTEKIGILHEETDVIVLPEMFNTGFSMDSKRLSEDMEGKSVDWMKQQAKKSKAVIVGSLIIHENNNYYNRLIWMQPDGIFQSYDKRHLFRMAGEHEHFTAGSERIIIDYKGWKICPLICYDLRFPVWSRNKNEQKNTAFDTLIYIANWPTPRITHWSKLLEARAIENQAYVVGVNRIGTDGKNNHYSGNSAVVDPKGNIISRTLPNKESTETIELSIEELATYRERFPVGLDADDFNVF